jgi:hypothetical protein
MRAAPRSLVYPSMAAIVAILAGTAWALSREPPPLAVHRLPDGTVLHLEAVTVGPQHRLVRGRYWQRFLAPLLPPAVRGRSGATVCTYLGSSPGAVIFWTTWETSSRFTDWSRAVAFDEHGSQTEVTARAFQESVPPRGEKVRGWVLPAFPRRGARLGLRLYVHGYHYPVAEFAVPNPVRGPYPAWTPSPLPITRQQDALAFTLTELATGREAPRRLWAWWGDRFWTHAAFRIQENGRPTDRWEPVGITLADATGNVLYTRNLQVPVPLGRYRQDGATHLRVLGNLPPDEAAWKLRAEFVPTRGFAPAELWTMHDIAVPKGDGETRSAAMASWYGQQLHLVVRAWVRPWFRGKLYLDTQLAPLVDGMRVGLVRATDDRGRACLRLPPGWLDFLPSPAEAPRPQLEIVSPFRSYLQAEYWSAGANYELTPPADAKRLNLTFAVVKSRFVDFLARPSRT